jgi:hypothetical protein
VKLAREIGGQAQGRHDLAQPFALLECLEDFRVTFALFRAVDRACQAMAGDAREFGRIKPVHAVGADDRVQQVAFEAPDARDRAV